MSRRVAGIVIIVVSVATVAVIFGLSYFIEVPQVAQEIPFVAGVPAVIIGWITFLGGKPEPDLDEAVQSLEDLVRKRLNSEINARGLNDSGMLPVAWGPSEPDLVESWEHVTQTALTVPGSDTRAGAWAKGPHRVSGFDHELAAVLQLVPTQRLVVLGVKGSGKTVVLIRLALDLLAHRAAGGRVPVILPLASWDPSQPLREWMISRLTQDYPFLKSQRKPGARATRLAEVLLDKHILLILDGLDEIPQELRGTALARIGKSLDLGTAIVLSCRTGEYRSALQASHERGQIVKLRGAVGISLRPLADTDIRRYLLGGEAPDSAEAKRWERVFRALGTDLAVAQALRTPLMTGLAREVYGLSRLERVSGTGVPDDPADLCDPVRFRHPEDVESHLFQALVRVAYQPRQDRKMKNHWKAEDAERWLDFLAHHLEGRNEIDWWNLQGAPQWLVPAVVGVVCGAASGVAAALGQHVGFGIGIGLGAGAVVGLAVRIPFQRLGRQDDRLSRGIIGRLVKVSPSWGIIGGLLGGVVGAVIGGMASKLGVGHHVGSTGGLAAALGIAIGVGSSTNFLGGLAGCFCGGFFAAFLEGVGTGVPAGAVNGLGMGLCAAFAVRFVGRRAPAYRMHWSSLGLASGLVIGIAVGTVGKLADGWRIGLIAGATTGLLSAIPCGLFALNQEKNDEPQLLSPVDALHRDYRTFWVTAPTAGLAAAAVGLFGGGLTAIHAVRAHADLASVLADGLGIGLAAGIIIALGFGFYHAASGFFAIKRCWLALRGALPWQLMRFLVDAHTERGILRQSGAQYQFRHVELMRWLAASYENRDRTRT
jgi:hypothetical protein